MNKMERVVEKYKNTLIKLLEVKKCTGKYYTLQFIHHPIDKPNSHIVQQLLKHHFL